MKKADRKLKDQLGFLAEEPNLQLALVFGSAALDRCRFDSDIDVAVSFSNPMSTQTQEQLIDEIDLQDILSINLERAVQLCVDVGAHLIADFEVPPPQTMGAVFDILVAEGLVSVETGIALRKAVGFRNLSVHAYDQVDWARVFTIVHERLDDFRYFAQAVVKHLDA